jgi:hypothetical protein
MPALFAALTLIAGFVIGGLLVAVGHVFIGIVIVGSAIPVALVVWMKAGERY